MDGFLAICFGKCKGTVYIHMLGTITSTIDILLIHTVVGTEHQKIH